MVVYVNQDDPLHSRPIPANYQTEDWWTARTVSFNLKAWHFDWDDLPSSPICSQTLISSCPILDQRFNSCKMFVFQRKGVIRKEWSESSGKIRSILKKRKERRKSCFQAWLGGCSSWVIIVKVNFFLSATGSKWRMGALAPYRNYTSTQPYGNGI